MTGRVPARYQLTAGFALHAVAVLPMLGRDPDRGAGRRGGPVWPRLVPALVVAGAGSGLINAALPRLAVESVPPERAAMGSGANTTARCPGSSAGVALTIAVAPTAAGADRAVLLSAAVALAGTAGVLFLRER
ncbi:hypothetical protein ACIRD6_14920 [Streptomyces sp. NPDC102473]|uniref:hypothetical protein n=1 Tax=Streptomyces sp. NPDC102473 TaxID=3366180 RepID=UPI00380D0121